MRFRFFIVLLMLTMSANFAYAQNNDVNESFWDLIIKLTDPWTKNNKGERINNEEFVAIRLNTLWKFKIGDEEDFSSLTYDDGLWDDVKVPSSWENDGYHGYDGFAWYRIHFDGRRLRSDEAHYLNLGFIDDVDETFLNGRLIGRTGKFPPRFRTAYDSYRKYYIDNQLINFQGDNVIAVKVYDIYKDGGIVNGDPGIYVSGQADQLLQSIYGSWKFSVGDDTEFIEEHYNDDRWDELIVPGHWDNQGYRTFDGIAWYRKKFRTNFDLDTSESYYLILGQIDDFDITYLNGVKIGETNDRLPFWESRSYLAVRVYKIPPGLLKESGDNLLSIRVEDIGQGGGIYTGPVGIVSKTGLTKLRDNSR